MPKMLENSVKPANVTGYTTPERDFYTVTTFFVVPTADFYGTGGLSEFQTELPMNPKKNPMVKISSPDNDDSIEVSPELYESIEETASIIGDAETMKALQKSKKQAAAGKTVSWDSVKADLGL